MMSITIRDLLRQMFHPTPRAKAPLRPRSFRPVLERLEDRTLPSSVTGVSPPFGPTTGNTGALISGSGFTGATTVSFGATAARGYFVISDSLIEAFSPPEPAGVVDVVVTAPSGISSIVPADQFTYQALSTTTSLSSSADPSTFGNSVTFTATVSNLAFGTPTGTVTFWDGTTALGTGTLSSGGQATFTTSALALGTHSITAVYSGDGSFAGSTSSTLTQNVDSATAYIWFGSTNSDWSTASNWLVNGLPATVAPGASNDVLFSSVEGTDLDCATNGEGTVSVHSITIDSSYTGTVHLHDNLGVGGGGFAMAGGNIDQPNGAGSDIDVTGGGFNWSGGNINIGTAQSDLQLFNVTSNITGSGNRTFGDNLNVNGSTVNMGLTAQWTFTDGAGITISNSGLLKWSSVGASIVTDSSGGQIVNNGGTFIKTSRGTGSCGLAYYSNSNSATLDVENGTMAFSGRGPDLYSVQLDKGTIYINASTLEADADLEMNGGVLKTAPLLAAYISGNMYVHGGTVSLGGDGNATGDFVCTGSVNMDGGTYSVDVDFRSNEADNWTAGSFNLSGTSTLTVNSMNVPAVLPLGQEFDVLSTPIFPQDSNVVTGDFSNSANIFITGTNTKWKAGTSVNNRDYVISTP